MKEHERLLDLVKKNLCSLGYEERNVDAFVEGVTEIVALKLADSNVVSNNKKNNGHQTHIAITGKTISFFFGEKEFEEFDNEQIKKIDLKIIKGNIEFLGGDKAPNYKQKIEFISAHVSAGKRTQNQLQLSKSISSNSKEFNELRNAMYANDLLIFLKNKGISEIICIAIKMDFYESVLPNYDEYYNSNTYLIVEDGQQSILKTDDGVKEFEVYTEKSTDSNAICYFCGCTLARYMDTMPETYRDNDIQRGIVKNVYLDRLVQTIIKNDSIPIISLVGEDVSLSEDGKKLNVGSYRILDGLQRSYRLNEIWKCMNFFEQLSDKESLRELSRIKIARQYSAQLKENDCNINVFIEIVKEFRLNGSIDRYWNYFKGSVQWFEVWENLTPEEETKKMLILNAGHKQMDIRHQLELLFLNLLPYLNSMCEENHCQKIIRNKDKSDMQYSKERKKGEYYFSHIISAAISYGERKAVTTNVALVNNLQQEEREIISFERLSDIMTFLFKLDDSLYKQYGDFGVKWIARETVLVGLFAALGEADKKMDSFKTMLDKDKVKGLKLNEYESAKNSNIEVSKVNVGNVTKTAVYNAIFDLLNDKVAEINWNQYFGGNE